MPIINLKMRPLSRFQWIVEVSGLPSKHVKSLQTLKPEARITSSYKYDRGQSSGAGGGASFRQTQEYFTLTWSDRNLDSRDTTAPVGSLSCVFNLLSDVGYRFANESTTEVADIHSSRKDKVIIWTFQF